MKAYVLHNVNDLRYEEVPMPNCPSGWVLVQVKASGICSSDIDRVFSKGTYHFPTIPGHEISGVVFKVGSTEDEYLLGKRVGVFPLIPCTKCSQCRNKHYEMCSDYDYLGSRRDGGFAEYVAVPVWNLIEIPETISFEEAAMLEPLSVGLHAIKLSNIQEQDTVAVIGTGMIGITAAQWAQKYTANKVVVLGRSERKRQLVEHVGISYEVANQQKEEYDVVIEAVGTPLAINNAINIVRPGGTLVLMGNPSGDITIGRNTYWRILRKQLVLKGTWNSSYDGKDKSDWTDAVRALSAKNINIKPLISFKYNQHDLMEGLNMMKDHQVDYCKVMTVWNE